MSRKHRPRAMSRSQRGLSLVELMVGITVGLFVVAAAATLVANQLSDNRRLLLETQVQQDLRATMDIITRQFRRAGAATTTDVEAGIAASAVAGGASNPHGSIPLIGSPATGATFSFYFDASQQGPYGFKLEDGIVLSLIPRATGSPQWQKLTDPNTVVVTAFSITPRSVTSRPLPCPNLCPVDATLDPSGLRQYCWPQLVVRSYVVDIQARAKSDPAIRRALSSDVRVRNDMVEFNGPTATSPVCPA
ncbi:MAG: hypothetical protein C0505_06495 [Leptothrix sp. (in: Bacteria)]|nr:hypothetical protein [Leptothrix sp. (in: b-proteobacteria)]